MSENNEIKWVEVEQVTPEQAAAKAEAPVDEAPAAFNTAPETYNAAPEADPFEVEPKLNKNVYGDNTAEPFESTNNTYGGAPNGNYTYHKEGRGTYQTYDQNAGGYNAGGNYNDVPPAHQKAVASLVLGIVGLCCCGICGLIGLIFSIQAKNEGNDEGIRKAGFILGCVSVALWVIGATVRMLS